MKLISLLESDLPWSQMISALAAVGVAAEASGYASDGESPVVSFQGGSVYWNDEYAYIELESMGGGVEEMNLSNGFDRVASFIASQ